MSSPENIVRQQIGGLTTNELIDDTGPRGRLRIGGDNLSVVPTSSHLAADDDDGRIENDNQQLPAQQPQQRFRADQLQFKTRSTGWAAFWGGLTGAGAAGSGVLAGAMIGGSIGVGFMGIGAIPGIIVGGAIGGLVGLVGGTGVGNAVSRRKANGYIESFRQRAQARGRTFSRQENDNLHSVATGQWKRLLSIGSRQVSGRETRNLIRDLLIERVATHGLPSAQDLKAGLLAMDDAQRREALVSQDARTALQTLADKGWLTDEIEAGCKRLSPRQERALLGLHPDLDLSPGQARDIQAQVLLAAGRAMTEPNASPRYALQQAGQVKQRLILQAVRPVPDDLPPGWKTKQIEQGWGEVPEAARRGLMAFDAAHQLTDRQQSYVQDKVLQHVGQAMADSADSGDRLQDRVDMAVRGGEKRKQELIAELDHALRPKARPSRRQLQNEAPAGNDLTRHDYGNAPLGPGHMDPLPLDLRRTNVLKGLVPDALRQARGQQIVQGYGQEQQANRNQGRGLDDFDIDGLNPRPARPAPFQDTGVAMRIAVNAFAADHIDAGDEALVDAAIDDHRRTAMNALGITAPQDKNSRATGYSPAVGLDHADMIRFQQLALTAAAIEDRTRQPDDKHGLTKQQKAILHQQLDQAQGWVQRRLAENDRNREYQQAFMRDFRSLSRSSNLRQLREIDAKLGSINSEIQALTDSLDRGDFLLDGHTSTVAKGGAAAHHRRPEDAQALGAYRAAYGQRKGHIIDDENRKHMAARNDSLQGQLERVEWLQQRRTELRQQRDGYQQRYEQEARPMVERYGGPPFHFDADPHHWQPGAGGALQSDDRGRSFRRDADFPVLQPRTLDTLGYIGETLLPDLQQQLDLLSTKD